MSEQDLYDMDLGIPGEGDQEDNLGKNPPATGEEPAKKPNIFVRTWRGIKKAHQWINNKISDHPNLAKVALTGTGAAIGIGAKIGYDYFRNRNNGSMDEFEPDEAFLPEPEEVENEYEDTLETTETTDNETEE